jgi:hypothetical protein
VLPVAQTVLVTLFGGWGLWIRNSVLSQPFFLGSTGWQTTARFHFWPWPYKFAVIVNMPAFLAYGLLSWRFENLWAGRPERVYELPVLLLVPLLWYLMGWWADRMAGTGRTTTSDRGLWILLVVFMLVCAALSSISGYVGGYTSWFVFGIVLWLIVGVGVLRKRKSKVRVTLG